MAESELVKPFVTFFTRTFGGRPTMMARCVQSIEEQDDPRWEHVILMDEKRRGIKYADGQFERNLHRINGAYVFVVDDDNALATPHFVSWLWDVVQREGEPDVVMFRCNYDDLGVLPQPGDWGQYPQHGRISPFNCIVKSGLFRQAVHVWTEGEPYKADYDFLKALFDRTDRIYWFDSEPLALVQRRSCGQPE